MVVAIVAFQPAQRQLEGEGLSPEQVQQVEQYLHRNLAADVRNGHLAGLLALSPFHFCRMFKKATGRSPRQFLIDLRLDQARHRLAYGRESVTEIALEVGYNSSQAFARAFRQKTDLSPSRYRELFTLRST